MKTFNDWEPVWWMWEDRIYEWGDITGCEQHPVDTEGLHLFRSMEDTWPCPGCGKEIAQGEWCLSVIGKDTTEILIHVACIETLLAAPHLKDQVTAIRARYA